MHVDIFSASIFIKIHRTGAITTNCSTVFTEGRVALHDFAV